MSASTGSLRENILRVQEAILTATTRAGRDVNSVQLVAISKTHPAELVAEAAEHGLRVFGENRVQEAAEKIPRVRDLIDQPVEWHLVGTLQRNKVKAALDLFAILQSVDSLRLAESIDRRAERPVPILLEVYFGDDPARPGLRPHEIEEQFHHLIALSRIQIQGLMTVAPLGLDERGIRSVFASLRELRERLVSEHPGASLPELSMGMTDDYQLAIAEGATIVRVGRAIFGARPYR